MTAPSLGDLLKSLPLYALPHHALSRAMHALATARSPVLKKFLIRAFIRRYRVDMREALYADAGSYEHFNDFFTRALQPGARPLPADARAAICPSDGFVSQIGDITAGRIVQAKGRSYSVTELLGGDARRAQPFEDGRFATLYLSPRDYHRVHMPVGGTLREMIHVPGRLFSVAPHTTRAVPNLFARNERVAALFDTAFGPLAMVLVGAIFVASIETVWAGVVSPPRGRSVRHWDYAPGTTRLQRGDEMGRFSLGSTVIVLFPANTVEWDVSLHAGSAIHMGRRLGILTHDS